MTTGNSLCWNQLIDNAYGQIHNRCMKYLSSIVGRPVLEPSGQPVGRIQDVSASQTDRLPTLTACLIRAAGVDRWIDLHAFQEFTAHAVTLQRPLDTIQPYEPGPMEVLLRRDVLDKQIVDVHDYRVVRANDVRIIETSDGMCVVGVDASLRAVLRRIGIAAPIEALARMLGKPLHSNLIAWDDVETLEASGAGGGRIRLKIPHERIARLHPADIADIVEQLTPQQRAEVIEALDVSTAADTIEEMEDVEAAEVMEALAHEKAADILEEMEPDDAADVLADLSEVRTEQLLEHMEPSEAAGVKELLAYEHSTAGGLMTTEYISVEADISAQATIEYLRARAPLAEHIYYVYIVDGDGHLAGVLSLRDLIVADPAARIGSIMVSNVRYVTVDEDADEVAQMIGKYNLLALPVVGDDGRLVGIVTVDDIVDHVLPPERRRRLPQLTVMDD